MRSLPTFGPGATCAINPVENGLSRGPRSLYPMDFGPPGRSRAFHDHQRRSAVDRCRGCVQGYLHIKANYQLITDNLLDLSHVHYLHPDVYQGGNFATFTNEVRADGDSVWSMLWRPDLKFDAERMKMMGFAPDAVIDGEGHSRWSAPSLMLVYTAWFERGKRAEEGSRSPSVAAQDETIAEAGRILRWAAMLAHGLEMVIPPGLSATAFPSGSCHTFQPERARDATRLEGADSDFSLPGAEPMQDRADAFPVAPVGRTR